MHERQDLIPVSADAVERPYTKRLLLAAGTTLTGTVLLSTDLYHSLQHAQEARQGTVPIEEYGNNLDQYMMRMSYEMALTVVGVAMLHYFNKQRKRLIAEGALENLLKKK